MNQITEIVVTSALGILTILSGIVVQEIKKYLIAKGGKKAVEVAEILAKNAVNATEQVADKLDIHGDEKLAQAKEMVVKGLEQYNINLTQPQIDSFIESAVKQMHDTWKE
ncbi:phage holin [Streptococcus merionis]|uniref:phage holin n=1 Tax=Streptococcus merionis TaxID=400065 RepID=UPI0035153D0C